MRRLLERGLHSRNGFIRKGCILALSPPKRLAKGLSRDEDFATTPPVLANSFPKSGTHLLDQILEVLPDRRNYGAFLSSMTSSFRFTRRSVADSQGFLRACVPGEIVRAHLFYDDQVRDTLAQARFVHYFIYRDPRDVVISEAHYYRTMNRWHRLHSRFRAATVDDAIMMAIQGIKDDSGKIYYPDIGTRFRHYSPWINLAGAFAVKFEDLTSPDRESTIFSMMEFYLVASKTAGDAGVLCQRALSSISPQRSHTFRRGKQGGWRDAFNHDHRDEFKRLTGSLLVELGYEDDLDWS